MFILMYISWMICFIILIMVLILNLISKKSLEIREKMSPFECGFNPMSHARTPFSLHFFLIAVIFVIFDVELALLLPLVKVVYYSNMLIYSFITSFFIIILLVGLYHEWSEGSLEWAR